MNSDWFGIGGGDGFYTAVDPTDYNIVYTESQDGNTNRYDLRRRTRAEHPAERRRRTRRARRRRRAAAAAQAAMRPRRRPRRRRQPAPPVQVGGQGGGGRGGPPNVLNATPGEQYRFNWNTPFILSPHNPKHRVARRQPAVQVATTAATRGSRAPISPSRSIATRSR